LDLERIVTDLKQERDRLSRAIAELEGTNPSRIVRKTVAAIPRTLTLAATGDKRRGKGLTPEGRRRLSMAMKKRWAERKKKASQ
jgi:hypothetical protein